MILGAKRGTVTLVDHQIEWKNIAEETIKILKNLFKDNIIDIQHVGSTSIKNIKAKPIIDIVVGIENIYNFEKIINKMEEENAIKNAYDDFLNTTKWKEINMSFIIDQNNSKGTEFKVFFIGNNENDLTTHHIHFVEYKGVEWKNYIYFRDYLIFNQIEAKRYEKLKVNLMNLNINDRKNYTSSKNEYITKTLQKAEEWIINIEKGKTNA